MHAGASGARHAVGHPKELDVGWFADREGEAAEEQSGVVGDADLAAATHLVLKLGLVSASDWSPLFAAVAGVVVAGEQVDRCVGVVAHRYGADVARRRIKSAWSGVSQNGCAAADGSDRHDDRGDENGSDATQPPSGTPANSCDGVERAANAGRVAILAAGAIPLAVRATPAAVTTPVELGWVCSAVVVRVAMRWSRDNCLSDRAVVS